MSRELGGGGGLEGGLTEGEEDGGLEGERE